MLPDPGPADRLARALSVVVIGVGVLALCTGFLAATYGHEGSSSFASPWVQWGQLGVAAAAALLAIYSTDKEAARQRVAVALASLVLVAVWAVMLVAGM
jgi:hypothetical protein